MEKDFGKYVRIFKALSDETRLRILLMLTKGQTCACKILEEFEFTQPTLSYHMRQLTGCGLIAAEKVGKWVHYSVEGEALEALRGFITGIGGFDG